MNSIKKHPSNYHDYTPGTALNYCRFEDFIKDSNGEIKGIKAFDKISEESYEIKAKVVINATGVFSDQVRKKANPELEEKVLLARGEHVSLDILHNQNGKGNFICFNYFHD